MLQKQRKKWIIMGSIIALAILLYGIEKAVNYYGMELRTFAQVVKGIYTWLAVPLTCIFLVYTGFIQERAEVNGKKTANVVAGIFLIIGIIMVLGIGFIRGVVYIFSSQFKEETKLEDGILELKYSDFLSETTTEYDEIAGFFFRKPFEGYTQEKAIQKMQERYGKNIEFIEENAGGFEFKVNLVEPIETTLTIDVKNDYHLSNNYIQELYHLYGETFFSGKNRALYWQEEEALIGKKYIPKIGCYGQADMEIYSSDITDFVEYCLSNELMSANLWEIDDLIVLINGEEYAINYYTDLVYFSRVAFYNMLYQKLEQWYQNINEQTTAIQENTDDSSDDSESLDEGLTEEIMAYYLSLEPACTFTREDGLEYRLIATDRACGSSFYSLIATRDNGASIEWYNLDPFSGSGGTAKGMTFIDEKVGFLCLGYSGDSKGCLYRTEDGGNSYQEILYPSAMIELPDGTLYNPFVMPQPPYLEDGVLYMMAGQGADGDYMGGDAGCKGRYQSQDLGKTWKYIGTLTIDN